jgi:signal peptide peptidase SppA
MNFPFLAQRLFNTPLAITPGKAEVVMAALAERMGIAQIQRGVRMMEDDDFDYRAPGDNPRTGYDVVAGVAVVQVSGTLVQKLGTLRPYSGMTGYDGIRQNFLTALLDPTVDAIVLDIDSPGGEVAGCFDLVDAIYEARGSKPIWAILNEAAYSAAYAIASAADRIYVPRTGGTGSVGVIWIHMDWSKALDTAGFKATILTYGDRKADGHPEIELSAEAQARFQEQIDTMGELFVTTVARNRNIPAEQVRATQAVTYLGAAGVSQGLADGVMAPDAAFRALLAEINQP